MYVQIEQAKAVRKKLRSYNIVTSLLLYLYIGHLFTVNPSLTGRIRLNCQVDALWPSTLPMTTYGKSMPGAAPPRHRYGHYSHGPMAIALLGMVWPLMALVVNYPRLVPVCTRSEFNLDMIRIFTELYTLV